MGGPNIDARHPIRIDASPKPGPFNPTTMKIIFASSEVVPFAKTGGLADVSGALPAEIARLGHEVTVFMPAYDSVFEAGIEIAETPIELQIPVGDQRISGRLLAGKLPQSEVVIFFVDQPD